MVGHKDIISFRVDEVCVLNFPADEEENEKCFGPVVRNVAVRPEGCFLFRGKGENEEEGNDDDEHGDGEDQCCVNAEERAEEADEHEMRIKSNIFRM